MSLFRKRLRLTAPREHADKLADAMGEGLGIDDARAYAGGEQPLRDFIGDEEEQEDEEEPMQNDEF